MTDFHNCCHGGSRDKLTTFWSNKEWMQPLNVLRRATPTPKLETKISDGRLVFPTAEEAACPWLLCTRIVNLVLDVGRRLGAVMHATLEEQMTDKNFSLMNRYIFEALPRSTKLRPLVTEFSH